MTMQASKLEQSAKTEFVPKEVCETRIACSLTHLPISLAIPTSDNPVHPLRLRYSRLIQNWEKYKISVRYKQFMYNWYN